MSKKVKAGKQLKVGDVIWTAHFMTIAPDGSQAYYWVRKSNGNMSDQEALETQEWHGPFKSEQEAEKDEHNVLLGKQCKVTEGGMWDPAWDKPQ